jgi:aminoglycoside phosphotransferase (APT) family kinase protein
MPIHPVKTSGWDNRTFHLGDNMLVRLPSAQEYAVQVEKEQRWLPLFAPDVPVQIPEPLALGQPGCGYPFPWSVYRWIEGETVAAAAELDLNTLAKDLADVLAALQSIDSIGGPRPGADNFYRGGDLKVYDTQARQALILLKDRIDTKAALEIWEAGLATTWDNVPVWVHGDISVGNLLVYNGRLSAVIDFGQLAVGDPACDLIIAWTFFRGESRNIFREKLQLDVGTWARARAWALWKASIVLSGLTDTNVIEAKQAYNTLKEVL